MKLKSQFGRALHSVVHTLRKFAYTKPLAVQSQGVLSRPRIGLALSGGFARGFAHLGVLKILCANEIPIDALAGTSVGSVVAACFASGCTVEEMIEVGRKTRWSSFARWTVDRLGLATNARMEEMLHHLLHCSTFEQLAIPLAVVTTDLSSGEAVTFLKGELIPPLRASCSIPGLFTPVKYQGRLLVDGAVCGSVPIAPLRALGVDAIIAVHLNTSLLGHTPTNMFQVIGQAFEIAQKQNQATWKNYCDVLIEPEVNAFKWDEFARADELILAGEQAALKALPALRALLEPRPVKTTPAPLPAAHVP